MIPHAQLAFYSFSTELIRYRWLLTVAFFITMLTLTLLHPGLVFADEGTGGSTCSGC